MFRIDLQLGGALAGTQKKVILFGSKSSRWRKLFALRDFGPFLKNPNGPTRRGARSSAAAAPLRAMPPAQGVPTRRFA
jgi:hypothetical protein